MVTDSLPNPAVNNKITICKNCKHWFTDDPPQMRLLNRGICVQTSTVEMQGEPMTHAYDGSQAHATATVGSPFGYQVVIVQLETTEDFGCNQFEEA
jgi:hypothetical protein